jgi:molybdate transport system ATP-binding protein
VLSTHRTEELSIPATHRCRIEAGRIVGRQRMVRQQRLPRVAPLRARRRRRRDDRSAAPALISLRRAAVWREGAAVLRNLSLEIESGQCWVVHGANGSGKSTLLQTLYGDLGVARGGTLRRHRIEPGVALQSFQRRVGLVAPELQTLYPRHETVGDVVASGLHASVGLNQRATTSELRRVRRALKRVGATALLGRTLRTLSYGQMRRVLFARALVNQPDILLLDEPYAGLDTRTRAALRALIERAIEAGTTTVITTHHHDEWPALASHELELAGGRARYCGSVRHP